MHMQIYSRKADLLAAIPDPSRECDFVGHIDQAGFRSEPMHGQGSRPCGNQCDKCQRHDRERGPEGSKDSYCGLNDSELHDVAE